MSILYEWRGQDGRPYRMSSGINAQHPMAPGQIWELQIQDEYGHWWAMVDWNIKQSAELGP